MNHGSLWRRCGLAAVRCGSRSSLSTLGAESSFPTTRVVACCQIFTRAGGAATCGVAERGSRQAAAKSRWAPGIAASCCKVWRGGGIAASFCNFGWAPGIAGARSKLPHSLAECLASPQAGAKSGRAGIAASCCKRGAACAQHTEHLSPKKSGLTASAQFQEYYRIGSGDHPLKLERYRED